VSRFLLRTRRDGHQQVPVEQYPGPGDPKALGGELTWANGFRTVVGRKISGRSGSVAHPNPHTCSTKRGLRREPRSFGNLNYFQHSAAHSPGREGLVSI